MKKCDSNKTKWYQWMSLSLAALSISWLSLLNLTAKLASAQLSAPASDCPNLEDIATLEQNPPPLTERQIVTAHIIAQEGLSDPSLWWAEEQFDEFNGKLVTNWIANKNQKMIYLVVNLQPWTLLDYLGRYRFVNKFGTVARDYDYNVKVCNQQEDLLASYTCNYNRTLPDCQIAIFKSFGRDSLPVPRRALGSD